MVSLYTKLKHSGSADGGQNGLNSGLIWTMLFPCFEQISITKHVMIIKVVWDCRNIN
jgi:hypothetical protein